MKFSETEVCSYRRGRPRCLCIWNLGKYTQGLLQVIRMDPGKLKYGNQMLRASEERYRSLVQENISDIITVSGVDGTVQFFESPSLKRVLGYQAAEQVGTNAFPSLAVRSCLSKPSSLNPPTIVRPKAYVLCIAQTVLEEELVAAEVNGDKLWLRPLLGA